MFWNNIYCIERYINKGDLNNISKNIIEAWRDSQMIKKKTVEYKRWIIEEDPVSNLINVKRRGPK